MFHNGKPNNVVIVAELLVNLWRPYIISTFGFNCNAKVKVNVTYIFQFFSYIFTGH